MISGTEVIIECKTTNVQVISDTIEVNLSSNKVVETIIGIPGPSGSTGTDGSNGAPGADGAGLSVGGLVGQIPIKVSATDFDLSWSANFTIHPTSGKTGIGTGTDANASLGQLQVKGGDLVLDTGARIMRDSGLGYPVTQIEIGTGPYWGPRMRSLELQALTAGVGTALWINGTTSTDAAPIFAINEDGNRPNFQSTRKGNTKIGPSWLIPVNMLEVVGGTALGFSYAASFPVTPANGLLVNGDVGIGTITPSTKLHVEGPIRAGNYTVATVPNAATSGAGAMIYVSDETGGPTMAFSDGANWRRMNDGVVIL